MPLEVETYCNWGEEARKTKNLHNTCTSHMLRAGVRDTSPPCPQPERGRRGSLLTLIKFSDVILYVLGHIKIIIIFNA